MKPHIASFRFLIGLTAGGLILGALMAEPPRYPELPDPFGAPPGPPSGEQFAGGPPSMANGERISKMKAPPPPPDEASQVKASELISEFDDSSESTNARETMEKLHALERFLDTPPEQLAKIRQTIERVEAMSPEERAALKEKICAFRNLQREKMDKLRAVHELWKKFEPEERRLVHRYMLSLPREVAIAAKEEVVKLDQEQAEAHFRSLLAKAQALDAAGELPDLPDNIRRWRERMESGARRDDSRKYSDDARGNAHKQNSEGQ